MEYCEFLEECKNRDSHRCINCEYNNNNFEAIEREENKSCIYKNYSGNYYRYSNNYDPE